MTVGSKGAWPSNASNSRGERVAFWRLSFSKISWSFQLRNQVHSPFSAVKSNGSAEVMSKGSYRIGAAWCGRDQRRNAGSWIAPKWASPCGLSMLPEQLLVPGLVGQGHDRGYLDPRLVPVFQDRVRRLVFRRRRPWRVVGEENAVFRPPSSTLRWPNDTLHLPDRLQGT